MNARSIQVSLSKSATTTPAAGAWKSSVQASVSNGPSLELRKISGEPSQPVTTTSMARSLFRSAPTAAMARRDPPRPAAAVQSVNVPLPLLRHSRFPGAVPSPESSMGATPPGTGKSAERTT
jgi:hypothetical protein